MYKININLSTSFNRRSNTFSRKKKPRKGQMKMIDEEFYLFKEILKEIMSGL
jgi:hypothetical protein